MGTTTPVAASRGCPGGRAEGACPTGATRLTRPVAGLTVSPSWTGMLLSLTEQHGLAVSVGPSWLLVHDLS
ncbi:hypothetical protein [Streptomyces sp. NPDC058305]|uniref:hypothetical protein n=1 Tax=Streptomyces sp. NPDC058305 TaxID=3346438 RepID=UPI0036E10EC7